MIIDKNLVFGEEQDIKAISGSATAVAGTDIITVGKADFGYKGMFFVVKADEEIKSASANGNVTISLEASDDSTFSDGVITLFSQTLVNFVKSTATVAKGGEIAKTLLRDCGGKKYLKVSFKGDGTWAKNASNSTMKVSAFITFDYPNK